MRIKKMRIEKKKNQKNQQIKRTIFIGNDAVVYLWDKGTPVYFYYKNGRINDFSLHIINSSFHGFFSGILPEETCKLKRMAATLSLQHWG